LKIYGGTGDGRLGFVIANLMCIKYSINIPIRFYIDTGSTITTLGQVDAQRIGIDYNKLSRSTNPITTANGNIYPHTLPDCAISFGLVGTTLVEFVNSINITQTNPISLLGLDVLRKFAITFEQDRIVLNR
jgi:clan AA aspartic protease (TIGR02281 family)